MNLPVVNPRVTEPLEAVARSLPISETFRSIQGEGKLVGVPSFFIRVSGCNLRCAWCDTPYASWTPDGSFVGTDELVRRAMASGVRHVVLTGGEPLLFPGIAVLSTRLHEAGFHITVETAGTVTQRVHCDLLSVSPKLANSTPRTGDQRDPEGAWRMRHEQRRLNPPVLQSLWDQHREHQLKFVVAAPADCAEIEALLEKLTNWVPSDILLMPEGVVIPTPEQTAWIVDECMSRGWRYCSRLHIQLFGNRRGT